MMLRYNSNIKRIRTIKRLLLQHVIGILDLKMAIIITLEHSVQLLKDSIVRYLKILEIIQERADIN